MVIHNTLEAISKILFLSTFLLEVHPSYLPLVTSVDQTVQCHQSQKFSLIQPLNLLSSFVV